MAFWGLVSGVIVPGASAQFTSLHVFGDGVTTTTNGPGGAYYYGNRFSNGRVWVEVLAERQGLELDSGNNLSYFGHYSPNLVANVSDFVAPPNVGTALFVIWINNADFVSNLANSSFAPYNNSNLNIWTNAINQSLSNHSEAIHILHSKGARTFVMPNAVDITKVPYYVGLPEDDKNFLRERVMDFNSGFVEMVEGAMAALAGTTIHVPDLFALFDDVIVRPDDYGLVNALDNGRSVDALSDFSLTDKSLDGPGASYIFWDYLDPTAKAHSIIADVAQQLISPARIDSIDQLSTSNRLELVNLPVGLPGFVESGGDLVNWTFESDVPGTNATQTVRLPATLPRSFYRLRFPPSWTWP